MHKVNPIRIRTCNQAPVQPQGHYVLYWMIANRRLTFNFALDRALEHCRSFGKPLVILEALRCGYQWASDRLHRFVLDGMADNADTCKAAGILYYPYVEPTKGAGSGLLATLCRNACLVVTDDFPCFFLPRMVSAAAKKVSVRMEAVDSNGMLPLRATDQIFSTAYAFRRFLQKNLAPYLSEFPKTNPLAKWDSPKNALLPANIRSRWPMVSADLLNGSGELPQFWPIDHRVGVTSKKGGHAHAVSALRSFLDHKLTRYAEDRSQPDLDVSSGLSPYLHFGHISVHEIFAEIARREHWKRERLGQRTDGKREGWWNTSRPAESFLDELVTWREVGYNFSSHSDAYDSFDAVPEWACKTLKQHQRDDREFLYSVEQFEGAQTHDPLWNAAQTQLVRDGFIHNYMRMLWGKKILEWSRSPEEASKTLIHLNNKYGLDGRNPNSYSGIFWCLGRYDRPWGPERPVYGTVRYLSSENTARKLRLKDYLQTYGTVEQRNLAF